MTNGLEVFSDTLLSDYDGCVILVRGGVVAKASPRGQFFADHVMAGKMDSLLDVASRTLRHGTIESVNVMIDRDDTRVSLHLTGIPHPPTDSALVLIEDRTFEANMRRTLIESRERYKDLVEVSGNFAFEIGTDGVFTFVSPAGGLGRAATDFLGRRPSDFATTGKSAQRQGIDRLFQGQSTDSSNEVWLRRADNRTICVAVFVRPIRDESGAWTGARGVCREMTHERDQRDQLVAARNREQLFNRIVSAIREEVEPAAMLNAAAHAMARATHALGCLVIRKSTDDDDGGPTLEVVAEYGASAPPGMNDIALAGLVEKAEEYHLDDFVALMIPTSYRQMLNGQVILWRDPDLPPLSEEDRLSLEGVIQSLGIIIDQINTQNKLVRLDRTDRLTGLLNRRAFFEEDLPRRVKRLEVSGSFASLLYVDVNNLKAVNDIRGHRVGDAALLCMRDLLLTHSRPSDSLARIDGDEFAMWMDGLSAEQAMHRAKVLVSKTMEELKPFSADETIPLGVSVGIAFYDPDTGEALKDFIARADQALIHSKNQGMEPISVAPLPPAMVAETTA